jgi:hypothetical protein
VRLSPFEFNELATYLEHQQGASSQFQFQRLAIYEKNANGALHPNPKLPKQRPVVVGSVGAPLLSARSRRPGNGRTLTLSTRTQTHRAGVFGSWAIAYIVDTPCAFEFSS